jgi:hypothetical protein
MKTKKIKLIGLLFISILFSQLITAQTYVAEFRDNPKLWGFITSAGKIIIPCQYASTTPFSVEGIAIVREPESKIEKYIDIKGNEIKLDIEVQDRKPFKDGLAAVKVNELWGYINTAGKLVIPAQYKKVSNFSEGRAWVTDPSGIISLLDKQGKPINISNLAIVNYENFSEGLAAVKIGENWGFIDINGKMIIPAEYMKVDLFSDGLAAVKIGEGQMGYINKKGDLTIPANYLNCEQFDPISKMTRVKDISGWFYIDETGKKLSVNSKKFNDFREGLCRSDNNSEPIKIGFIKKDGSWAIEPQYDAASNFQNGFAPVRVNKSWGAIDKSGKLIIETIYNNLEEFHQVK